MIVGADHLSAVRKWAAEESKNKEAEGGGQVGARERRKQFETVAVAKRGDTGREKRNCIYGCFKKDDRIKSPPTPQVGQVFRIIKKTEQGH